MRLVLAHRRRRFSRLPRRRRRAAAARSRLRRLPARPLHDGVPRGDTCGWRRTTNDAAAMTLLGELYNQGLGRRGRSEEGRRMVSPGSAARRRPCARLPRPDGARRARHGEEPGAGPRLAGGGRRQGQPASPPTTWPAPAHRAAADADLHRAVELLQKAADAEIAGRAACPRRALSQGPGRRPRMRGSRPPVRARRAATAVSVGEVEYAILLFNGDGVPANEIAGRAAISAAPPPRATPSPRTASPASRRRPRRARQQGRCRRLAYPRRRPGPQPTPGSTMPSRT